MMSETEFSTQAIVKQGHELLGLVLDSCEYGVIISSHSFKRTLFINQHGKRLLNNGDRTKLTNQGKKELDAIINICLLHINSEDKTLDKIDMILPLTQRSVVIQSFSFQALNNHYHLVLFNPKVNGELSLQTMETNGHNLREMQQLVGSGFWIWRVEEDQILWSDETYRIFEEDPSEFKPNLENYLSHIHPEDISEIDRHINLLLNNTTDRQTFEHRIITKSGNIRFVSCLARVMQNSQNQKVLSGVVYDITEKKRLEFEKQQLQKDLDRLFNKFDLGLVYLSRYGSIVRANDKFGDTVGYTSSELRGSNILELLHDRSRKKVKGIIRSILKNEPKSTAEITLLHKSEDAVHVDFSISLVNKNYHHADLAVAIKNVKLRKRLENELQVAIDELENFIYMSSHFLRGPVSSIIGLCDLAFRHSSSSHDAELIEMIQNSSKKMDHYLHDLLRVTDLNRIIPEHQSVDLHALVSNVLQEVAAVNLGHETDINLEINSEEVVVLDKSLLKNALVAVVDNALRYKDEKKEMHSILIKYQNCEPRCLHIIDNGCGIEQDRLESVTRMFYRGHSLSDGMGLGLFLAFKSLSKIEGRLEIESAINKGTHIKLIF